jgi:hypothetical protein
MSTNYTPYLKRLLESVEAGKHVVTDMHFRSVSEEMPPVKDENGVLWAAERSTGEMVWTITTRSQDDD